MIDTTIAGPGRWCWMDLAATDLAAAQRFYAALLGWRYEEQAANGGVYTRVDADGVAVGSMYQLSQAHRELGMPSHWMPYVRVERIEAAVERAEALGATVLVRPFAVADLTRVAVIADPVGACLGLWEPGVAAKEDTDA